MYLSSIKTSRDAGRAKLLSRGARCDHRNTLIFIYQKATFDELCQALPLSSAHSMCVPISIFPIQILIERKCEGALFVLHRLERYKYLREGHSVGQTVV